MDLNRIPSILLQTFLTIAEAGELLPRFGRLHLSQPTVTGHIRRLEANLETNLFIRSAKGVSLTERGAHLRESVQDVFAELEQILQELDRTREVNGTLTLAASTTVTRYFVPKDFYSLFITTTRPPLCIWSLVTPKKCWTIFDNSALGSG